MTQVFVLNSTKEDVFICGLCKSVFTYLPLFLEHKNQKCVKVLVPEEINNMKSLVEVNTTTTSEVQATTGNVAPECLRSSKMSAYINTNQDTHNNISTPISTSSAHAHSVNATTIHCKLCRKPFKKLKNLLVHLKTHNGKPYQCLICGRCFGQNSHLQRHEMSHKIWPVGLNEATVKTTDVDALSYTCIYCDHLMSSYSQFRAHLKRHSSLKQYQCIQGDCVCLFDNIELLLKHVMDQHVESWYTCHLCLKQFGSLEEIATHQQNHDETVRDLKNIKKYKCDQCDACFMRKERLTLHLATENHRKICIHCNKIFVSDKRLRLHLQIHRNIKPFHCNICGNSFHMKKYLTTHLLKHGERQYCCSVCNFKFKRRDLLKRHMRSHLNKKYFQCPFHDTLGCKMEFNRNDKLKLHIKHHTKQLTDSTKKNDLKNEPKTIENATSTMEILIVPLCDKQMDS